MPNLQDGLITSLLGSCEGSAGRVMLRPPVVPAPGTLSAYLPWRRSHLSSGREVPFVASKPVGFSGIMHDAHGARSRAPPSTRKERQMAEGYRCESCNYYHIGALPDVCPVCGADQKYLVAYEGPGDLTGTKTLDNLMEAFVGESQANRRYTLFSRVATAEGAGRAVAAFDKAAAQETAHALGALAYMGAFSTTADNIEEAMAGEEAEFKDLYTRMANDAKDEGFPEIAAYFRALGRQEFQHHSDLSSALLDVKPPQ
jgi:rubrerythrin